MFSQYIKLLLFQVFHFFPLLTNSKLVHKYNNVYKIDIKDKNVNVFTRPICSCQ